ncbi:MAG: ZIP family metal transporter, partial [Rubrobacteridae bacterium]|nr:ZIP family metal transporter [Rubrobacteridae bacterium]
MDNIFKHLNPVAQALFATIFTWGMTALGASVVFIGKGLNQKVLDFMLGFAGGVMIAASFWSLLSPALALANTSFMPAWLTVSIGFLLGGTILRIIDRILPHLHYGFSKQEAEGLRTNWKRSTL